MSREADNAARSHDDSFTGCLSITSSQAPAGTGGAERVKPWPLAPTPAESEWCNWAELTVAALAGLLILVIAVYSVAA